MRLFLKKIKCLLLGIIAFFSFNAQSQTLTDIDGNIYNTVKIGKQEWMKENLKTTHYQNGVAISNKWGFDTIGAYFVYPQDTNYKNIYGLLYKWYTVTDSNKICPVGWHVPTTADWRLLFDFIGGDSVAGGKLKEEGTSHWLSPNTGATNESEFSGLPAGLVTEMGYNINNIGKEGGWWCSTDTTSNIDLSFMLNYKYSFIQKGAIPKTYGFSIRCLKDSTNSITEHNNYELNIFPNPAKNKIIIIYSNIQSPTFTIYNLAGCQLMRKTNILNETIIDVGNLLPGVYIINLATKVGTINKKLIIE